MAFSDILVCLFIFLISPCKFLHHQSTAVLPPPPQPPFRHCHLQPGLPPQTTNFDVSFLNDNNKLNAKNNKGKQKYILSRSVFGLLKGIMNVSILFTLIFFLICAFALHNAGAQFFTKTSKSIPRMGRQISSKELVSFTFFKILHNFIFLNLFKALFIRDNKLASPLVSREALKLPSKFLSSKSPSKIQLKNDQSQPSNHGIISFFNKIFHFPSRFQQNSMKKSSKIMF